MTDIEIDLRGGGTAKFQASPAEASRLVAAWLNHPDAEMTINGRNGQFPISHADVEQVRISRR